MALVVPKIGIYKSIRRQVKNVIKYPEATENKVVSTVVWFGVTRLPTVIDTDSVAG